jgi:hypothetical protein
MPILTREEVTIRDGNRKCCSCTKKSNYELKNKCKSDFQPTSKEHVYCVVFYMISYIQVHIQSWHIANARKKELAHRQHQKESMSCTRLQHTRLALDGKYF